MNDLHKNEWSGADIGSFSVCMFSNLFPPVVSGSSTQTFALAREFARRGCEVAVITAKVEAESEDQEVVQGVHIYRLPALRLPRMPITFNFPWMSYTFTPWNLKRIYRIVEKHDPDVLHLQNHMFDLAFSAALTSRKLKRPLVVTIHTVLKHDSALFNLLLHPIDRLILKPLVMDRTSAVICPDINIRAYVQEAFGRSAHIIPYGIDLPAPPDSELIERIRAQHGLGGRRMILSVGHVHAIRNRRDIVEALPTILARHPDTVLLIIGNVGDSTPLELARKLGVSEAVIFAGPVPHPEIPAYLALADLEAHWLSQDGPEKTSLGVASLEAMAAGKLILAAANEETYGPGILRNNENLVLVEPGRPNELANVIIDLLSDEDRRNSIGRRARQTIHEHFSWNSLSARVFDVYRQAQEKAVRHK
jgi:glycosyltransferase involved in cell wall biosynthesis